MVLAGRSIPFSVFAVLFEQVFRGSFVMSDHRPKQSPTPHLQTRPATMLTAIGLCAIIVLIQLVPEIQSMARLSPAAVTTTR
jgi:hypothetical protein